MVKQKTFECTQWSSVWRCGLRYGKRGYLWTHVHWDEMKTVWGRLPYKARRTENRGRRPRAHVGLFGRGQQAPFTSARDSGERCELPSRVWGGAPTAQFSTTFSTQDGLSWHYNTIDCGSQIIEFFFILFNLQSLVVHLLTLCDVFSM